MTTVPAADLAQYGYGTTFTVTSKAPSFLLFVESVIQVTGEAEVWMLESRLETRLHPHGQQCPACPFWTNRDRWTGEVLD